MQMLGEFVLKLLTRFPMARWSPLPLRLIVGYGFMQHGFAKLSRGPDAFVVILQAMGVPAPHAMAWLTILTELICGLAVLLGAFVTIVSVPMMAVLAVAMFTVHLPYGFSSIKLLAVTATGAEFGPVGYEVILLYFACIAALVVGGPGPFAIDGLLGKRLDRRPAAASQRSRFSPRDDGCRHATLVITMLTGRRGASRLTTRKR
jgi:putative oxidoreductase